jgi:hypothetical protein
MLLATAYSLQKPAYNYDILPYMGVILSYDKTDIKIIHSEVYTIAKKEIPPLFYNRMVDPSNAYRSSVAQSPEVLRSQFPFYVVKPFYTRAAYLFYKAGICLTLATVWPSAIAYFLTGLLLFNWLKKYWPGWYACAGSSLIMLSPPVLNVAGLSTPDALSGLLLLAAVYFLAEKKSIGRTLLFLLLAVFARLDNILPAICLLSAIFFTNKWHHKISAVKIVFFFSLLLLAYFTVSGNARSFGWSILYYPAFAKQLNVSYTANSSFDFAAYLTLAKSQFTTGWYFSFISLFFFLVLFLLWDTSLSGFNSLTMEQVLAIVFALIIIVRFILQPLITDRIYVPYYLSVIVFVVKKYSLMTKRRHALQ